MSDKLQTERPVSDAVAAGWAIVTYAVHDMGGAGTYHNLLLERQGQHKIVTIRRKMLGEGHVVEEIEV